MEQLGQGSRGIFPVDEYPLGGTKGLHRPTKLLRGELTCGGLQILPLPLQPSLWGKALYLAQRSLKLCRWAWGLLHHQGFQGIKIPASHMAGKAGDCCIRDLQVLCQLPNKGKQEGICVSVDIVQVFNAHFFLDRLAFVV